SLGDSANDWQSSPVPGMPRTKNPWFLHQHSSADGNRGTWFLCSLTPGGEQLTGVLKSKPFNIPSKLSFWIAGHDGIPSTPLQNHNFVRLREAGSDAILAEARPPRNDMAQKVEWDLSKAQGKTGYLEFTDNNTESAYAWLALGRFEPEVVAMPKLSPNQIPQRLQSGAEIARSLKLQQPLPLMSELLTSGHADSESLAALGSAIASIRGDEPLLAMAPLLGEADVPAPLQQQLRAAYQGANDSEKLDKLVEETFRSTAYRIQLKLAQNLAATHEGAETLLANIENQRAPARLLQERSVHDKLVAAKPANADGRIAKLTANLSKPSDQIEKVLEARRKNYDPTKADKVRGQALFVKNCSICHQIDGQGAVVGPQLDGIGNRGLERLTEDVLDPNRNVDRGFRTQIMVLKDGDVVSGLPRREQGELIIFADSTGKEISVPIKNIAQRRDSDTSLMPENFADVLTTDEFNDLMSFLLSKVPKK
ncbi:MAG: Membrane-bound dehydrogenase domain protein, partial [Verrucomicrobiales bacterium]|nr:Membrane-bound dehydrogenase domain protein [Verrucomicrobiales bacterium]